MFIYLVTNKVNGKIYVGKTKGSVARRWICHVSQARRGGTGLLWKAIRKYGAENFSCVEIDRGESLDDLRQKEDFHIARLHSADHKIGYNMQTESGRQTEETIEKIREARKHQGCSAETRLKMSMARKGMKLSEETKRRMSEASPRFWLGKKMTPAACAKMKGRPSLKTMLGKKHTEETRAKMRLAHVGRIYPTGKDSPTYGRKHSPESILRMKEAGKKFWAENPLVRVNPHDSSGRFAKRLRKAAS